MMSRQRLHDGIVGVVITAGVALGYWVNPAWLAVPGIVGVLLIQSWFTGFCPVYYTLDRLGIRERQTSPV